jgi:hypothetical protein
MAHDKAIHQGDEFDNCLSICSNQADEPCLRHPAEGGLNHQINGVELLRVNRSYDNFSQVSELL